MSEPDLLHAPLFQFYDDLRSPKGIPADMVLASLPITIHHLRLLLPWRSCERICAVPAPCTSFSFSCIL
jgi:hypothetical protein